MRSMGLSGTLPGDWGIDGGLQSLRQLWVDGNDLSGAWGPGCLMPPQQAGFAPGSAAVLQR